MYNEFNNPGPEWRGKPFWSWNGDLEEKELIRQIHVLKNMGMGGYFMHSRTGLATEYLGDEWFRLINSCADEGEKLGLESWLYDEDRWPSGTAGGEVTRNPKYRKKFIYLEIFQPSEFKFNEKYIAVFTCKLENEINCSNVKQISAKEELKAEPGEVVLAFSIREQGKSTFYNGFTYVDTQNAEATDNFIQRTHEKYKEKCGDRLGKSIKGMFTDEPNYGTVFSNFSVENERPEWHCPWTNNLDKLFEEKFGYSLISKLPELFLRKNGERISQVKWHYVELIHQLFLKNFAEPCAEWCRENNLNITGHVIEESSLSGQTIMAGSVMRYYETMDCPGIDVLSEGAKSYWSVKQLSSVARQTGKKWLLSELYGCTGWQMNFKSHKAIGDWQTLFGINLRCHHLSWYTMKGEAKRDYPASIFHQSAWWEDYDIVETYFARFGYMLTQGMPCCDVLVISPLESVWSQVYPGAYRMVGPADNGILKLEGKYQQLFHWLAGSQIDFDYADEDMMSRLYEIDTDSGKSPILKIGKASYKTVVVGGLETIRMTTLSILEKFVKKNKKIIFAGESPAYVDALKSDAACQLAEKSISIPFEKNQIVEACEKFLENSIKIVDTKTGKRNENIFCQLREADGEFILAAINVDRENPSGQLTVKINVKGFAEEWDCLTGEKSTVDYVETDSGIEFQTSLTAVGSRVFRIVPEKDELLAGIPKLSEAKSEILSGPFNYSLTEPNICVLDMAEYKIDDGDWQPELEILKVDQAIRNHFNIPIKSGEMLQPWFSKKYFGDKQHKEHGKISLKFPFEIKDLPEEDLTLCMETPEEFAVKVNGQKIDFPENPDFWIDICFKKVALPVSLFNKGLNFIELETAFREDIDLETIYLIGNFGMELDGCKKTIVELPEKLEPRCVTNQGLPFYSGGIRYKLSPPLKGVAVRPGDVKIQNPKSTIKNILKVPAYEGALIKIISKAEAVKRIPWLPNEADITEFLDDQNSELELEIVLTRKNTFGPLHETDRKPVSCGPANFTTGGAAFSEEYILYPAGLLAPPVLTIRS